MVDEFDELVDVDDDEELLPTDEHEGIIVKSEPVYSLEEAFDVIEALGCKNVMLSGFYERSAISGIWSVATNKDGVPYVLNNFKSLYKLVDELSKEIKK